MPSMVNNATGLVLGVPATQVLGLGGITQPVVVYPSVVVPRIVTESTTCSPGEEIWVLAESENQIILTAEHSPQGAHIYVKLLAQSTGTVLIVASSGLIDAGQSYLLDTPGQAVELSSDGTDFSLF